ncbi:MAG: lecithin retinol acyltransferase family protein [Treponema sp.]|nr:lecithin retinol acyltransferase family protein [Treponema sp.]
MRKKLLIYIGIPAGAFLLFWLVCIIAFPVAVIDEVTYNKHKLNKISRQRNVFYGELLTAVNDRINTVFGIQADLLFNQSVSEEEMYDFFSKGLIGGIIDEYYFEAGKTDTLSFNKIESCRIRFSFPLQHIKNLEFTDVFPKKITIIEYENVYYDKYSLDVLSNNIESLKQGFFEESNSQIDAIINDVILHYEFINVNASTTEEYIYYSDYLADHIDKTGKSADLSVEFFNYLLSECVRSDISNLYANSLHHPVDGFLPIRPDVYEINGIFYHSVSLNKMNEFIMSVINDWERFSLEIISELILLKTIEITLQLDNILEYIETGFLTIINTAGYRFYNDMINGYFFDFYVKQCEFTNRSYNVVTNNTGMDIHYSSLLPVTITKIDEHYFDAIAVDLLIKSMNITSSAALENAQGILIDGINHQTDIFENNINEYVNWYSSVITGIDRTIAGIAGILTGEGFAEERYYTDNFYRIINNNAQIGNIINNKMVINNRIIADLYTDYLKLLDYFALNTDHTGTNIISINDFIGPFINNIVAYFDIIYDLLEEANYFFYQDYTTDDTEIIRLFSRQNTGLKQRIIDRMTENQRDKLSIINDPFNFYFNKIGIGSLLFVDNYFASIRTYRHYGVYTGNGTVIHYAPLEGNEISFENGIIHETTLEKFLGDRALKIDKNAEKMFSDEDIVLRARSRLGEKEYDLLKNNCEHFARWSVTGNSVSYQVENLPQRLSEAIFYLNDNTNVISRFIDRFL